MNGKKKIAAIASAAVIGASTIAGGTATACNTAQNNEDSSANYAQQVAQAYENTFDNTEFLAVEKTLDSSLTITKNGTSRVIKLNGEDRMVFSNSSSALITQETYRDSTYANLNRDLQIYTISPKHGDSSKSLHIDNGEKTLWEFNAYSKNSCKKTLNLNMYIGKDALESFKSNWTKLDDQYVCNANLDDQWPTNIKVTLKDNKISNVQITETKEHIEDIICVANRYKNFDTKTTQYSFFTLNSEEFDFHYQNVSSYITDYVNDNGYYPEPTV